MSEAAVEDVRSASTWRYSRVFWTANIIELFERAAYYGTFIALALFLSNVAGYSDIEAGYIGAIFSASIYFLPFLTGAAADRIGFRAALILAFALLTVGYAALGLFPAKGLVLIALAVIAVGGSFVKPVITGTVARESNEANRARAYSLFYMLVNIGSFSGKTVAKPVRVALGVGSIPLYSAGAALIALVLVALFYWPKGQAGENRSARAALIGIAKVLRNGRFMALILITSGFWVIQGQLYASMPKYVLRTVGESASPEWYANINPFVVVVCVVWVTQLVKKYQAITSIGIGLALIPMSALLMALSPLLSPISIGGELLHPVTVAMIAGIAIQGLAECFLSPRYLEYASKQAPAGEEGLYLGYAQLNTFFAWLFGFILSGYLLDAFCPDPKTLTGLSEAERAAAYAHAHYIWYVFAGVGAVAFLFLLVFQAMTKKRAA